MCECIVYGRMADNNKNKEENKSAMRWSLRNVYKIKINCFLHLIVSIKLNVDYLLRVIVWE